MKDFDKLYNELKDRFNAALIDFLRPYEKKVSENLYTAMRYSVVNSGKRIRPILCMLGARFAGGGEENVMTFAIAAELIHTYSLVHDDLPAVDNDSMRRGRLTTHVMHGEAMGVFAGDALLNLAYEIMTENVFKTTEFKRLRAMLLIMKAAGAEGLLNGQAKDVDYDNCADYLLEHIVAMYRNKTADLIRASLVSGALICGAKGEELEALSSFADSLGIYFQLQDDLMDEGGDGAEFFGSYFDGTDGTEPRAQGGKTSAAGDIGSIFDIMNAAPKNDEPRAANGQKERPFADAKNARDTGSIVNNGGEWAVKTAGSAFGISGEADGKISTAFGANAVNNAESGIASGVNKRNGTEFGVSGGINKRNANNADSAFGITGGADGGNPSKIDAKKLLGLDKTAENKESGKPESLPKIDAKKLLGLDKTADELLSDPEPKVDGKALLKMGGEQNAKEMFKPLKKEKMTFLKAAGEDAARKLMAEYEEYIREALSPYGERADELLGLFEFIKNREN
ncbi:MAG: polyprenyl synthetase family protein [Clostridiales bacterium]|jgi:geranylgeranyl pyrophosphate synthase|nr:polyprenyl synthetase family protein [Clostridiales bacterium]